MPKMNQVLELEGDLAAQGERRKRDNNKLKLDYRCNIHNLDQVDLSYLIGKAGSHDCIKMHTDGSKLHNRTGLGFVA